MTVFFKICVNEFFYVVNFDIKYFSALDVQVSTTSAEIEIKLNRTCATF